METQSPWLEIFNKLAAEKKEINLLNIFKGVPISHPANILEVTQSSLRLKAEGYQIVCLYRDRETYLQSPLLPEILKARVSDLDLPNLEVTLAGFRVVKGRVGERTHVRVQPGKQVSGEISSQQAEQTYQGDLADISQDGMAIYISERAFTPQFFFRGAELIVNLRLPGLYEIPTRKSALSERPIENPIERFDRQNLRLLPLASLNRPPSSEPIARTRVQFPEITIHGTIANTRSEPLNHRYRIGIHILPTDPSRFILIQFISQRQAEIIREIREIYNLLLGSNPANTSSE